MQTTLSSVVDTYFRAKRLARATRNEYLSTIRKWEEWGGGVPIQELGRRNVREFLDWVYERAVIDEGINPGRTANKAREHLRAVISWAWEQEMIDTPPRFPNLRRFHRPTQRMVKLRNAQTILKLPGRGACGTLQVAARH